MPDEAALFELVRPLLDRAPVGYIQVSATGDCLRANEAWCRLSGRSEDALLGSGWIDALDPRDKELFERWVAATADGDSFAAEFSMVSPDGRSVRVLGNAIALDGTGVVTGYAGSAVSVKGCLRAEERLREAEHRYRTLVEHIPVITYEESISEKAFGGFEETFVSPQLQAILGYSPEEWTADPELWVQRLHPDDRERVLDESLRTAETGEPFRMEYRMMARDGSVVWLRDESDLCLDSEGSPRAWHGVMTNITEVKVVEEEHVARVAAERANHAKDEFLSRMSHEIRTPLNAILGFGQILEMDELTPDQSESVGHVMDAGRHLLGLVNDLLDISRIESGSIELDTEEVEVAGVVGESVDLIRGLAAEHGVVIEMGQLEGSTVVADRLRLRQVLANLLSNGVKYNRPGGEVKVLAVTSGGRCYVAVIDNGIGIEPEHFDRVFEPFERVSEGTDGIEGTGLGLAVSKRLVEAMGGKLHVTSTPGEGSAFLIELELAG